MGRRLIATAASLAVGLVGALILAAPASASTSTASCNFPDAPEVTSLAKPAAQDAVDEGLGRFAKCLEINWTDQCDGKTFVSMTNWVKNDNDWTVVTVKLLDKEYVLEGGSSPNTEEALIGPKVENVQAYLIFRGEKDGTKWEFQVPFGEPHTWKDPGAVCPSPSPSPSASASASPSPTVGTTTSAPKTSSSPAAAPAGNDLPVTGASATLPVAGGLVLLLAAASYWVVMIRRRRKVEAGS